MSCDQPSEGGILSSALSEALLRTRLLVRSLVNSIQPLLPPSLLCGVILCSTNRRIRLCIFRSPTQTCQPISLRLPQSGRRFTCAGRLETEVWIESMVLPDTTAEIFRILGIRACLLLTTCSVSRSSLRPSINGLQCSAPSDTGQSQAILQKVHVEDNCCKEVFSLWWQLWTNLIDHGIYREKYRHPDGRRSSKPDNWMKGWRNQDHHSPIMLFWWVLRGLCTERWRYLKQEEHKEDCVLYFPRQSLTFHMKKIRCWKLKPLTDERIVNAKPDLYDRAHAARLDQWIRSKLGPYIIPSTQHHAPILPNFLLMERVPMVLPL
jgi:hypothetical protein